MTPDQTGFPTPEPQRDPTPQDLQDLEMAVSSSCRGDLIHKMDNHLGVLASIMELARVKGWDDSLRNKWNLKATEINKAIAQVRLDQAQEKGLL